MTWSRLFKSCIVSESTLSEVSIASLLRLSRVCGGWVWYVGAGCMGAWCMRELVGVWVCKGYV